jgi:metal-sulfur cluster biosynthetic enzyme
MAETLKARCVLADVRWGIVREGTIEGTKLKLRTTLTAENTPLNHVVEETIDLR